MRSASVVALVFASRPMVGEGAAVDGHPAASPRTSTDGGHPKTRPGLEVLHTPGALPLVDRAFALEPDRQPDVVGLPRRLLRRHPTDCAARQRERAVEVPGGCEFGHAVEDAGRRAVESWQ